MNPMMLLFLGENKVRIDIYSLFFNQNDWKWERELDYSILIYSFIKWVKRTVVTTTTDRSDRDLEPRENKRAFRWKKVA